MPGMMPGMIPGMMPGMMPGMPGIMGAATVQPQPQTQPQQSQPQQTLLQPGDASMVPGENKLVMPPISKAAAPGDPLTTGAQLIPPPQPKGIPAKSAMFEVARSKSSNWPPPQASALSSKASSWPPPQAPQQDDKLF